MCGQLPKTIRSYQKLSGTIKNARIASKNYPELSKTIRSYQELSGTIKKCTDSFPKLSGTIKNYPELSKAIRNYQKCTDSFRKLSGTIKNYPELYLAIRMRKTDQVSQDFAQVFPNRPLLSKLDPGYSLHSSIAAVFSVPIAGFSSGQPVFDPGYPFRLGRILRVSSRRPQSGNPAKPKLSTRPELIPTQRRSIGIARKMRKKPSRTSAKFRLWILNAR